MSNKNEKGHIVSNHEQNKKVLYIGNFFFPFDNAAGKRVYTNGKVLKELGYDVIYIGLNKKVNTSEPLKNTRNVYDGFVYYNLAYPKRNIEWLKYKREYKNVVDLLEEDHILDGLELVICYGTPRVSFFMIKLIRYCRQRNIKVVSDCTDWLTTKTNRPLFNLLKWANTTFDMVYVNKKADGIIAISSFLASYYDAHGCKTVVIPPLSFRNHKNIDPELQSNKVVITYAGLPFRLGQRSIVRSTLKDRIDKMIILLYEAKRRECNFICNIYGFTKEEYLKAIPSQKKYLDVLGSYIVFHGYLLNEKVMEHVRNSDYTILIRDVKRDTMAGFPTKISESISCGTPVITTQTSDLKYYIIKGMNGFFLDISEKKKATDELVKILNMDREKIIKMKTNCVQSEMFYYKNYLNQMKEFLDEVMN